MGNVPVMTHDTPLSPRPPHDLVTGPERLLTSARLRAYGVTAAETAEHCRPGGPWQQLLPGVVLLRPGPPTSQERLHAVLLYAARERAPGAVPAQPGPGDGSGPDRSEAMITGLAALTLHGVAGAPPLPSLDVIDVLVPRQRRLRSAGCARIVRTAALPGARTVTGVPVAPVARALADAVAGLTDPGPVRRLLTEAVRGGHCEPAAVVRELRRARLLSRPHVVDAVESLVAEGRALAEERLYRMVREYGLPEPVWNVDLRLPGGPSLGGLDAYWPEQAVAVALDTRAHRQDDDALWARYAAQRERLEGLGITVVHLTPRKLRDCPEHQAVVVRTALMAANDREPASYVVVLPR
ncbi:hypothetical protein GCM10010259_25100 [Streptomyces daghestanicus]|nr:hypothetical protein GCM10010240_01070 [Streptomyces griseoviridis]GGU33625.1 hypothetical protein GCM10010259_25100 [Streptomyces daghestanicus]GHI34218.1 hypothetical protein Sdagh_59480 [Streptomyces daghestanicus]